MFLGLLFTALLPGLRAACTPPPSLYLTAFLPLSSPLNNTDVYSFSSVVIEKALAAAIDAVNIKHAAQGLPAFQPSVHDIGATAASFFSTLAQAAADDQLISSTIAMHGPVTPGGDDVLEAIGDEQHIPFFDSHPYPTSTSPYFHRIIAVMNSYVSAFSTLLKLLGVSKVTIVSEEAGTFSRVVPSAVPLLTRAGLQIVSQITLRSGSDNVDQAMFEDALDQIAAADERFVIVLLNVDQFARMMYYGQERGMFGVERPDPFVLVGPIAAIVQGLNTIAQDMRALGIPHNVPESVPALFNLPPDATMEKVLKAASGGLIGNYYGIPDATATAELEAAYIARYGSLDADFTGYTSLTGDFVYVLSGVVATANAEGRLCEVFGSGRNGSYVLELLQTLSFEAPSGNVTFSSTGEKRSAVVFDSSTFVPATAANNYTASINLTNKLLLHAYDDSWHSFDGPVLRDWIELTSADMLHVLHTFNWNTLGDGLPAVDSVVPEPPAKTNMEQYRRIIIASCVVGGLGVLIFLVVLTPFLQAVSYRRTVAIKSSELQLPRISGGQARPSFDRKGSSPAPDDENSSSSQLFEPRKLYGTAVHLLALPHEPLRESPYPRNAERPVPVGRSRFLGVFHRDARTSSSTAARGFFSILFGFFTGGSAVYGISNPALPWQIALTVYLKRFQNRNVVQCCGVVERDEGGHFYLVLEELVQSLAQLSETGFRMKGKRKAQLIRDIAQGLLYLAEVSPYGPDRPILRYGLRPSMVFTDRWGTAKIVPMISEGFTGEVLQRKNKLYSIFIAPEVISGKCASEASDCFTLGSICWMVLNNVKEAELIAYAENAFLEVGRLSLPWKTEVVEALPLKVVEVVNRALSYNKRDRPTLTDLIRMTDSFSNIRGVGEDRSLYCV